MSAHPLSGAPGATEVPLGWRTSSPQAALAFLPPEPMAESAAAALSPLFATHAAGADPARRMIVVRASYNVRIRYQPVPKGQIPRFALVPEPGSISQNGFKGLVTPIMPDAQRAVEVPACQISLNLIMVSDVPCRLQLMPPYLSPGFRDWPGSLVCGRFPLENWPRSLNAILEWQDLERDWVLRRGEPLVYLLALYDDPSVVPRLVEAASHRGLERQMKAIDAVSEVARNVGPMFEEAERRRPPHLLVEKRTWR